MLVDGGAPTLTDCRFEANVSENGGGLYCENTDIEFLRCDILFNSAVESGAGLNLQGASVSIRECSITGNTSDVSGGGVLAVSGSMSIIVALWRRKNCS